MDIELKKRLEELEKKGPPYTLEDIELMGLAIMENHPELTNRKSDEEVKVDPRKLVNYKTWKPPQELLDEYKEELEALHKWARQSRGEE